MYMMSDSASDSITFTSALTTRAVGAGGGGWAGAGGGGRCAPAGDGGVDWKRVFGTNGEVGAAPALALVVARWIRSQSEVQWEVLLWK